MKKLILLLLTAICLNSFGQQVVADLTFNPGTGFDYSVRTTVIQPDGKIIVGGDFWTFNGVVVNHIVRLNSDGSIDPTFNQGSGFNDVVNSISIQSDGKIIIGGSFTYYNGTSRNGITRLNSNGSIDTSFDPGTGFDGGVTSTAIQQDGKIFIGGYFQTFNGTVSNNLARLNSDGSTDVSFNQGIGFDNGVNSISIQSDGKIIVGGGFSFYNGIAAIGIARLNSNGNLDLSFDSGVGFDGIVTSTNIQQDGKIIIGGTFTDYNFMPRNRITRLNSNGSIDTSFDPGTGFDGEVKSVIIQSSGKIIVGGDFFSFNGTERFGIARLNSNGSLDATLAFGELMRTYTTSIQSDGKIIIGGAITFTNNNNGTIINNILRLDECGVATNQTIYPTACDSYLSPTNQLPYYQSGVYHEVLRNINGCDSVNLTINLMVLSSPTFSSFNVDICNGNSYTWNNITYLSSGVYQQVFSNQCYDSTVTLYLNFYSSSSSFNATICSGSTYNWNGQYYTQPGQYNQIFTNQNGCDSIVTLNLIVSSPTPSTLNASICQGAAYTWNGQQYAQTGQYIDTLSNQYGCDSIVTLNLTISSPTSSTINISPCWYVINQGQVVGNDYTWPLTGITYYQSGQYTATTTNTLGCDSVVTLNLVYHQNSRDTAITICNGDYFEVGGLNYQFNQSGNYFIVLNTPSVYGCDSILFILVNIIYPSNSSFTASICPGSVYTWNGQQYNSPGQYQQSFSSIQTGCDSTVTLNLSFFSDNFNPTFSSAQQLFTAPPFAVQFSNSTANASNYSFMWDFGDGTTLASNNASVFHQYSFNGQYTVSLIATDNITGCSDTTTLSDYIFCTGGVSCTHAATINQTSPQQACQGTPLWLSCNSDPSFTYQWRRNGVTIPGNNNDSLQVSQSGTYSVIISVNNCPITSGDVVVTIFSAPSTPIITSSGTIQPCVGGSVTLNAGSYTTYNWSTGATTQSINVTNSGNYSVSVSGANGCSATSAPFNVNASFVAPPQVCIVGMDSLTNENRIVWEKPITTGIDSFYVYKESNVSNVYTKIGATDYNDLAVFLDVNSNPAVQAYRYKISALDTCGTESNVGDFHKTIHLTINQGVGNSWNLIWSHYEGLNFGSYNIYRGTSLSNMALLTTIQSNLNSYTDLTPPTGPLFYQIEVVNPNNCDPTKIMNYGLSKSNIVDNGVIGISEEVLSTINVYPNPTNDKFTLNVSNDLLGKGYVITDFSGRIISQGKINSLIQIIDIQEIAKGSYFLQIDKSKAIKIIKQ